MADEISGMLGQEGSDYIAGTDPSAPSTATHWTTVKAIGGDAVIAEMVVNTANVGSIDAFTLLNDDVVHGEITRLTLTSGKVMCYRSANRKEPSQYFRPGGVDKFKRPGGTDEYYRT